MRTWKLGQIFKIKLWMVGQQDRRSLFTTLQRQIAKKILKSKAKACPVIASYSVVTYYMVFKYCISFAEDLAPNLGFDWFRIMPKIVSKLYCAVQFKSEQTHFSWTGRWFRILDLLLCTGFSLEYVRRQ